MAGGKREGHDLFPLIKSAGLSATPPRLQLPSRLNMPGVAYDIIDHLEDGPAHFQLPVPEFSLSAAPFCTCLRKLSRREGIHRFLESSIVPSVSKLKSLNHVSRSLFQIVG